jgi:hypothetical protein
MHRAYTSPHAGCTWQLLHLTRAVEALSSSTKLLQNARDENLEPHRLADAFFQLALGSLSRALLEYKRTESPEDLRAEICAVVENFETALRYADMKCKPAWCAFMYKYTHV